MNALPIAAGMAIFSEGLPDGASAVARVLAFGAVVAGAGLLAHPETSSEGRSTAGTSLASS